MRISDRIWKNFSNFVSWGMGQIPYITVWTAEKAFFLAPKILRSWVDRYTSERILACIVSGHMPMLPNLNGGDAILFYPLKQCKRYELLELPNLETIALFEGKILAFVVPVDNTLVQYHVCGYDDEENCYDAGLLFSHGANQKTQFTEGIKITENKLSWPVRSKRYLTSFVMLHSDGKPLAAGYSQRTYWNYPDTRHLPHVVIPPNAASLDGENMSAMVLIVDKDAWVPEIIMWTNK